MRTSLFALTLLAFAPAAAAQDAITEGYAHYEEADFAGALAAFSRAEDATEITRDDLIRIYVGRALVHFALDARSEVERALRALLSIDPAFQAPPNVPPAMGEALDRMRASASPMRVTLEAREVPGGARLEAELDGDPASLSRGMRIRARDPAVSSAWVTGETASFVVPGARAGVELEVEITVLGPGGAELHTESQRVDVRRQLVEAVDAPPPPIQSGGGVDLGLVVGLSVGIGVALIAAAAVLIALFAFPANDTLIDGPHFRTR